MTLDDLEYIQQCAGEELTVCVPGRTRMLTVETAVVVEVIVDSEGMYWRTDVKENENKQGIKRKVLCVTNSKVI